MSSHCVCHTPPLPLTGGALANHAVRQALVFLNILPMQSPELYVAHAAKVFGPDDGLTSEETRAVVNKFSAAFAQHVNIVLKGKRAAVEL